MSVLVSLCLAGIASQPMKAPTVEDLKWMVGNWTAKMGESEFHESWMSPSGGTMQGVGRQVQDNETGFMEFMSIEATRRGLTMYMLLGKPSSGVAKPVPFHMIKLDGKSATFQRDEEGDFPKRIIYAAMPDGTLNCRIEDDKKKEVFVFNKK